MSDALPCPWCGKVPDLDDVRTFRETDGPKWGALVCCCIGPEVRTGYRPVAEWREAAIAAWNDRAQADAPAHLPADAPPLVRFRHGDERTGALPAAAPARDAPRCNKPGQCPTPTECRGEGDCLRNTAAPAGDVLVAKVDALADRAKVFGDNDARRTLREAAAALAQRDVPREPTGAMLRAAGEVYKGQWCFTDIWKAMYDAAIAEGKQHD